VGFLGILLVFLFGSWSLPYDELKPEDQIRNYVTVVLLAMTPLLLVVACGLAASAFRPTSSRKRSTQSSRSRSTLRDRAGPVPRLHNAHDDDLVRHDGNQFALRRPQSRSDAKYESFKVGPSLTARRWSLKGRPTRPKAKMSGKEWDYRTYILRSDGAGPADQFAHLELHRRSRLPASATKFAASSTSTSTGTTKGQENKGVFCTSASRRATGIQASSLTTKRACRN